MKYSIVTAISDPCLFPPERHPWCSLAVDKPWLEWVESCVEGSEETGPDGCQNHDKGALGKLIRAENKSSTKFSQSRRRPLLLLKAPTSSFIFKTLLRHYAKQVSQREIGSAAKLS